MSIPERLWRVVKGQWALANERLAEAEAQAEAYRELADTLRKSPPEPLSTPSTAPSGPVRTAGPVAHDPLEASYLLLEVPPGASLQEVEIAYRRRLNEVRPEQYAPGTSERALQEGKREAIHAAYEKLRDMLNPTETRFERLEF